MSLFLLPLAVAKVVAEFRNLSPKYQQPIADITKKMGNGMADFATMGDVQTTKEYNLVRPQWFLTNTKARSWSHLVLPASGARSTATTSQAW